MIEFIIKKTIRDYQNTGDKKVREAYAVLSGTIGILCNIVLSAVKVVIGMATGSIAVLSDGFNNMTDLGSSAVSIIGARLSTKPPDEDHPYGHGRSEYIASLVIAFLIFSVGFRLLGDSYDKLIHPERVIFSLIPFLILICSILVKLWMYSYNMLIAKKIRSSMNRATATDSLNDCVATSAVAASMAASLFTDLPVDGAVGIGISILILYSGFKIARDTVSLLLGSAPDPELVKRITDIVRGGRHILDIHELKFHDYGPSRTIVSVHAEVADTLNIVEGHASLDELERIISDEFGIEIIIHMDPVSTDTGKIDSVRRDVASCLRERNAGLDKFRIASTTDHTIVIFDLILSTGVLEADGPSIQKNIKKCIEDRFSGYEVIINNIRSGN